MKRQLKRSKWITIAAILTIVALVIAFVAVNAARQGQKAERDESQQSQEKITSPAKESPEVKVEPPAEDVKDEATTSLDPETVGSTDIPQAGLTVSYMKGVGGFEYEVLRSTDGRKYVELRNSELAGTKCNQDTGVFVSILQEPNESEKATINKTTNVDGVEYGLSVASPTCTNDAQLLEKYQEAFIKPFSLLKKLN